MITEEQFDSWMSGQRVPGVRYVLQDSVKVRAGMAQGHVGVVIGLLALPPNPRYLVETASAGDYEVSEQDIEPFQG